MAETENLCEHCTAIDFEQLRLPFSKDVEKLNEGQPIEDIFHLIDYRIDSDERPHWGLGAQSCIQRSAATCPFCREVSLVLETSGVRGKAPAVFEKDPICDVFFTKAGEVRAPPGVIWKRYASLENPWREWLPRKSQSSATDDIPYPRISLRWTVPEKHPMPWFEYYPNSEGVIELSECFQSIEMGMNGRRSLFSGRKRPALIDLELPRRWLRNCLENDNNCCAPKPKGEDVRTSVFRLIDTKAKSVVEFDEHCLGDTPYVTLSYVWGTTQQAMLKRENYLQLQLAGSLADITPQTVTDAIVFTSDMGYQYLWVDLFCIIQNDDADKMSQLQMMGDIYKNSVFTIVAAAGENSGSGLAGIRTPRTVIQRKVQVKPAGPQDMPLWLISTIMPRTVPSFVPLNLPWQTRGWTLQEIALSRRVFIFTAEQLLWSCTRCCRWEETDTETELASLSWDSTSEIHVSLRSGLSHQKSFTPQDIQIRFWALVWDFSKRNLCFDGDAHDAFSAILREYTEMTGEQFLWGLPVSKEQFGRCLCWETTCFGYLVRRECLTTLPTTSLQIKVPFPSWSWLGWKGDIISCVAAYEDSFKLTIRPYVLRNTPVRLVEISDIPEDNTLRVTPSSTNGGKSASPRPTPSYPSAFESLTLEIIYKTLSPDITPERLSRTPDDQLLFFWCERAHLYLGKPGHDDDHSNVYDEEGDYLRTIRPLSILGELNGRWEKPNPPWRNERMKVEFIAIARYSSSSESSHSRREKLYERPLLFLINRRQGFAYRVATINDISMRDWLKCKRERVLLALG